MDTFLEQINELQVIQKDLVSIHPMFAEYYPVVVAYESLLYIYDYSIDTQQYEWVKTVPDDMNIPEECMAAFPIPHMDWRICAVVTDAVFQSFEQKVYLFHEFVHCYVYEQYREQVGGRIRIKSTMEQRKRVSWEIDYEFPYDDETIVGIIDELNFALRNKNLKQIREIRTQLFSSLSVEAGEFWNWLEWNEGYARYIENLIRAKFELEQNHVGTEKPFSRLVFYATGSAYIDLLVQEQPVLHTDLAQLFEKLEAELVNVELKRREQDV
ncbi:hypothetical protein J2W91_005256 [Paenibacillus amylolyticus]|uniref:Uncharacterized protein n=1 Tax=Paenibacillus amylolyticus TaxID=1451 RepID=A0AAP5HAD0_PAEAM|nr:hypothetical protein [Paenibacillus amylolyticus]MDR6726734.1 hypothetical protein [Paenibacillus amylolyticus]